LSTKQSPTTQDAFERSADGDGDGDGDGDAVGDGVGDVVGGGVGDGVGVAFGDGPDGDGDAGATGCGVGDCGPGVAGVGVGVAGFADVGGWPGGGTTGAPGEPGGEPGGAVVVGGTGDGAGLIGGGPVVDGCVTLVSCWPSVPRGRSNETFVVGSTIVNWLTTTVVDWMTVMFVVENVVHRGPVKLMWMNTVGLVSGLPQKQRVTGNPNAFTSTAVPACSTDGTSVACPLAKPWLMTNVSERRIAGVSSPMNFGMSPGWIPSTAAQAAALSE
jgi:hypothetical protein